MIRLQYDLTSFFTQNIKHGLTCELFNAPDAEHIGSFVQLDEVSSLQLSDINGLLVGRTVGNTLWGTCLTFGAEVLKKSNDFAFYLVQGDHSTECYAVGNDQKFCVAMTSLF